MTNDKNLVFQVEKSSKRLDLAISKQTGFSRNKVKKLIEHGFVSINQNICKTPSKKLMGNEEILINLIDEESEIKATNQDLEIIYQDEHIAVINKVAGLTVHPCPSCEEETLVHGLLHHFPKLKEMGGERPGIVHRLDKDTSGLMLIALHEKARLILAEEFALRNIKKTYLALVHGLCEDGESSTYLGRHPSQKTKMAPVPLNQGGREAFSSWKRLFALEENLTKQKNNTSHNQQSEHNFSLIKVEISTGRTHQIRVHLSEAGHALLGDSVYAKNQIAKLAPRQMLHAHKLSFLHPISQEEMSFQAPIPQDFYQTIYNLGAEKYFFTKLIITGKSGSGKSTVLNILKQKDMQIFSADACVQELYEPNQEVWVQLKHRYGEHFFIDERQIDKNAIFLAMENPNMRREIEMLIHPLVFANLQDFFQNQKEKYLLEYQNKVMGKSHVDNYPFIMAGAEIPLWHESKESNLQGSTSSNYIVICLACPEEERLARLKLRGWNEKTIAKMDSWQFSQADKEKKSDYILQNTADFDLLEQKLNAILEDIKLKQEEKLSILLNKIKKI